ncbi:MAG TPA: GatB/YqeY domain-containing protein [Anaerolineaceae bacterium]|nr:GatB/YqeY domain-containing protein [Anaerolineaceae bacterium]
METKSRLEAALKDAMRANDDTRRRAIRGALAAIKNAEIDKGAKLDESALASVLQKEIKSRRESIQDAEKANRPDLIQTNESEIAVLEQFLPQPLTDDELRGQITAVIGEVGATSPSDMGKVMKILLPRLQGRAASDRVSQMVRQILQS